MIDFNEFDTEEHQKSNIKVGDSVIITGRTTFYTKSRGYVEKYFNGETEIVTGILKKNDKTMYRFFGYWPWYDIKELDIVKI